MERGSGAELEHIEAVYRARLAEFRRVAAAVTGDRQAALDVVQEAFGAAIRLGIELLYGHATAAEAYKLRDVGG
jgi:DNA-directed RNA polymerase specialized sigma24 family protein